MTTAKKDLTKNEWAILSVLWQAGEPLVVAEIVDALSARLDWPYQRYLTQLSRLCEKGFLTFERRGRIKFYSPAVGMEECVREESKSLAGRMTDEVQGRLLLCMLEDRGSVTEREAEELHALIEKLRGQSNGK